MVFINPIYSIYLYCYTYINTYSVFAWLSAKQKIISGEQTP